MKDIIEYSGITTKIRAMKSRLITDEQYREMVSMPNVVALYNYLKGLPGYSEVLENISEASDRIDLERKILGVKYDDYASLYSFAKVDQKKFLKFYAMHYEIRMIKRVLNSVADGLVPDPWLSDYAGFFDRYTGIDLRAMLATASVEGLIDSLKDTDYYESLRVIKPRKGFEIFDYETALDFHYFRKIWKNRNNIFKDKKSIQTIADTYGTEFDMLNLCWIKRSRTYFNMSPAEMYAILIPIRYKLSDQQLRTLTEAESDDDFKRALSETYYARVYDDLTPDTIFRAYADIPRKILHAEAVKNPYSIATIMDYLYMKELEVTKIIISVECVRYGMPEKDAYEYISHNNEVI